MRLRRIAVAAALVGVGLSQLSARPVGGATDVAGIPAALVGEHGPTQNVLDGLELVGHSPIVAAGETVPLGNHGAPALIGDCAYVGRWHDYNTFPVKHGVQIIDVADPANPVVAGHIPATIKQGAVAREIRAVDLPGFKLLVVMLFGQAYPEGPRTTNNRLLLFTVESDCRTPTLAGTFDMSSFRGHEFFLWDDPNPAHNVAGHPRILAFVTAPLLPPNVLIVDVSNPAAPVAAGVFDAGKPVVSDRERTRVTADLTVPAGLGTYAHSISVSEDGTEAYLSYWDGGFFTMDSSDFAAGLPAGALRPKGLMSRALTYPAGEFGNTHSAVKIPGTNAVVAGDEIYASTDGCPFGWLRTFDLGNATTAPSQIGEFRLIENQPQSCEGVFANVRNASGAIVDGSFSMHNQTITGRYALVSWYGAGLRVIDLADPAHPAEAGFFVPKPLEAITRQPETPAPTYGIDTDPSNDWWIQMWSYPIVRNGLIYVTDTRNGLYILRPAAGAPFAAEVSATAFREGNSTL